jgi:hypothetical protein
MDQRDIPDEMLEAALTAAQPRAITPEEMRRILAAAMTRAENTQRKNSPYPLWVSDTIGIKRARFVGVTDRRCYYRVETEDGKALTVHGNDIQPAKGPRP